MASKDIWSPSGIGPGTSKTGWVGDEGDRGGKTNPSTQWSACNQKRIINYTFVQSHFYYSIVILLITIIDLP